MDTLNLSTAEADWPGTIPTRLAGGKRRRKALKLRLLKKSGGGYRLTRKER